MEIAFSFNGGSMDARNFVWSEKKVFYYNEKDEKCSPDSAVWIRQMKCIDTVYDLWIGFDLYKNTGSVKRSKGVYVRGGEIFYPADTFTTYYKTGDIESTGGYLYDFKKNLRNEKRGDWKFYFIDGHLKSESSYTLSKDSSHTEEYLMNYWEATGKQVIANGEGIYSYTKHIVGPTPGYDLHFICQYKDGKPNGEQTGYYPNGKLFCKEQFSKGDLVQGESYDGFDTKYTYNKLEEYPQFPGGDTALIRFLQKNITYPEGDRDNDIQGNVLIRFVVDRGGGVRNVTVARGVTKGLNNEAVRVVKMLPNFKPGRIRGQAVDVYYNLPVVFRLQ